jgi:hypothetical protein
MRSQFDGLRSILGNSAVPVIDAPAVEEPRPDTFADLPDLSELDSGLYKNDPKPPANTVKAVQPDAAAFDALDCGLGLSPSTPSRAHHRHSPKAVVERTMSTRAAVGVMACGLILGAGAAIAVFFDDVTRILARAR